MVDQLGWQQNPDGRFRLGSLWEQKPLIMFCLKIDQLFFPFMKCHIAELVRVSQDLI